ncbi:hypothetical protein KI688_001683 [Linnemannia hyalina]|uniref:Uncharacterized protein n=1 Tax=Linnemannia hyalina TaxID=64524 RepID=A0A9P7XTP8_9FUNG|nr:hypothetical protein KI688_001683 [Linnemannia hyalina]
MANFSRAQMSRVQFGELPNLDFYRLLSGVRHIFGWRASCCISEKIEGRQEDNIVDIGDIPTREARITLVRHDFAVTGIAYSPEGYQIATACKDTTVPFRFMVSGDTRSILQDPCDSVTDWVDAFEGKCF